MTTNEDQFLKSLRATFKVEAGEHLEAIADGLLSLEKPGADSQHQQLVETVFRAAHSLKGAARAVNFPAIESVCQALEDVFAAWKRREITPSMPTLDVVHQALAAISRTIADPEAKTDSELSSYVQTLRGLSIARPGVTSEQVSEIELRDEPETSIPAAIDKTPLLETVRVDIAKLDARLLEAEEMLAAKLVTAQRASDLRELLTGLEEWKEAWARIQPDARAFRQTLERPTSPSVITSHTSLKKLLEFFEWNQDYFRSLESRVAVLSRAATQDNRFVGKLVDDLLEDSRNLLMLPLSTLAGFLQKLVRDLCRDQNKQAHLVISGEAVEIDKRILEEMKDPLIHLIRNCVDHGLESPQERTKQGKPASGAITLALEPLNGDKIELVVSDDGAGIDIERLKEAARKRELITAQEADQMSDAEALQLIFQTDISTSRMVTELSGRGLGLAIVREQTEKLGGHVSVESVRHAGTTIRITLPVSLRTHRGILVETARNLFVVPTAQVEKVTRFRPGDIQTVEGRETLTLNGRAIALTRLADVLELESVNNREVPRTVPMVVLRSGDDELAFAVDAVLDEQEVLVRPLVRPLERVRNIAGATVLGSGQVVPILNVSDLIKSAKRLAGTIRVVAEKKPARVQTKSILLVEDSITSRMLLKGILESAGYRVTTAVDGVDAFTTLRTQRFDLVVSDVEMPRLNGFDLTAKIRSDKKLAELPVVLVTALETREDRERGVDAGANAYLVKSSFDQSNLLDAVRRLA